MSDMHIKGVTLLNRDGGWTRTIFDLKQVTFSCLTRGSSKQKSAVTTALTSDCAAGEGDGCCHVALIREADECNFLLPTEPNLVHACASTVPLFTAECEVYLQKLMAGCCEEPCKPLEKWLNRYLFNNLHPRGWAAAVPISHFALSVMGERISSLMVSFIFVLLDFIQFSFPESQMNANEAGWRSTLHSNAVLNCYCAVIWNGELRLFSS